MKFFFCSYGYLITRVGKFLNPKLDFEKYPESMFWGFALFDTFIPISLLLIFNRVIDDELFDKYWINRYANPLAYIGYGLGVVQYFLVYYKQQWVPIFRKLESLDKASRKKVLLSTKAIIGSIVIVDLFFVLVYYLG